MVTLSQIKKLENLYKKRKDSSEENRIIIPESWSEFCELTTIKSGNKMVSFSPYPFQIKLIELMESYPTVIVIKSRQLGITQCVLARFLHKALLNQAYTAVSFFKNGEDRGSNSERVRQMARSLCTKYEIDNVSHQKWAGLGEIYLKASGGEGSRGYDSVSGFLFDEAAFTKNIESIYSASSASSAMVGDEVSKVILSTPSAKNGWYWEMLGKDNDCDVEEVCQAVVNGDLPPFHHWVDKSGTTCKVVIHWKCHPIYSQRPDYLEYRQRTDNCTLEKILREYNLAFVNTEESVFAGDIIRLNATGFTEEKRDLSSKYYIGIDTAHMGADYYVAWILKEVGEEYHSVKWYRARGKTKDYNIARTTDLIQEFKPVRIGVESNSGGQAYLEDLIKLNPSREIIGLHTSQDSKIAMIDRMILAMERKKFVYPKESPIYDEMLQFVRKGNKLGAADNAHDDCVMAAAIALAVTPIGMPQIEKLFFKTYFPI